MERLAYMMDKNEDSFASPPQVFFSTLGEEAEKIAFKLANELRVQGVKALINYNKGSLKSQMRRANKMDVQYVLILGEDELKSGKVVLRDMKRKSEETIHLQKVTEEIVARCST